MCSFISRLVFEDSECVLFVILLVLCYQGHFLEAVRYWILKSICFVDLSFYIMGHCTHCIASLADYIWHLTGPQTLIPNVKYSQNMYANPL